MKKSGRQGALKGSGAYESTAKLISLLDISLLGHFLLREHFVHNEVLFNPEEIHEGGFILRNNTIRGICIIFLFRIYLK